MSLKVAVQMDPIARINIRGDSTFAMLLEAQRRGHAISYYTPDKLAQRGRDIFATVQPLERARHRRRSLHAGRRQSARIWPRST